MEEENCINEGLINNYEFIKPTHKEKIMGAICKFDKPVIGTGFYLKIPYKKKYIKALLTCNHVLKIEENMSTIYYYNENIKKDLDLTDRFFWQNGNNNLDYTCIQILEKDIKDFLEIDKNVLNENYSLENGKRIQIYNYEKDQSVGNIQLKMGQNDEEKNFIYYNCDTQNGWSGGPILNCDNLLIGVHKGFNKEEKVNFAINIKCIINDIINNIIKTIEVDKNKKESFYNSLDDNNSNQDLESMLKFEIDNHLIKTPIPSENKKKFYYILFAMAVVIIALVVLLSIKELDKNPDESDNMSYKDGIYWYENEGKKGKTESFQIFKEGVYKVCVFGAKAIEGGRGGKQCATHTFKKGDFIDFYLEGRSSGGEGGKNCGYNDKDGFDGAGLAKAEKRNHPEEFEIFAGGGGGNSEDNLNKGGDYEKDGEGAYKGGGATSSTYGKKGDDDAQDGSSTNNGGKGGQSDRLGCYCGGGGGNGYYGGGGGGFSFYKKKVGGGGGGSNFCNGQNCEKGINDINVYAGYKIESL